MVNAANSSSILGDIASLLGAVAWPIFISVFLSVYRKQVSKLLSVLILKVERAKTIKAAGIELAEEEIRQALDSVTVPARGNEVPQKQVEEAKTLAESLTQAGVSKAEATVSAKSQWQSLAQEYEDLRLRLPRGPKRTAEMNRIMSQMRTLGLLVRPLLAMLSRSQKPGERLVAIASLQVKPDSNYAAWLAQRMSSEDPFVFFHAALALQQLVMDGGFGDDSEIKAQVKGAIRTVESFTGGEPDRDTLKVLNETLNLLEPPF